VVSVATVTVSGDSANPKSQKSKVKRKHFHLF
jgi:hypothetical protein